MTPIHHRGRAAATLIAAVLLLGAVARPAAAQAPFKVLSPAVVQGELSFETFGRYTRDNDPAKNAGMNRVDEIEYSPTSWWRTAFEGQWARDPGGTTKYDSTEFENVFQLTEPGEYWMTVGLLVEYERPRAKGDPDEFEPGLLLQKEVGRTVNTVNFLFPRQVGPDSTKGQEFAYAAQSIYRIVRQFGIGLEAFGAPGEFKHMPGVDQQDHRLGPVVAGKFNFAEAGNLRYEVGYERGLTSATPNTSLRWLFEYELFF